jgi:hypothetical protein
VKLRGITDRVGNDTLGKSVGILGTRIRFE